MAKNKDRRHAKKPDEPVAVSLKTPSRRDVLLRVEKCFTAGKSMTVANIASQLKEPRSVIRECVDFLVSKGSLEDFNGVIRVKWVQPTVTKPRPVSPEFILRLKNVSSPLKHSSLSQEEKLWVDILVEQGLASVINDCVVTRLPKNTTRLSGSFFKAKKAWKSVCPLCGEPASRHERSKTHDTEKCKMRMVERIMEV